MVTKRIKQTMDEIETREEMEATVERIARATIARDGLMAEMDHELTEIRARYEPQITAYGQELDAAMALAQRWAEANPAEFNGRKSIDMMHGVVGFRTGTPKLKLLSGWTWTKVLDVLKLNKVVEFVRTKEEVDKECILANRETISEDTLKRIGVKVVQDESFFVEPKRDDPSVARKIAVAVLLCLAPLLGGCAGGQAESRELFYSRVSAYAELRQAEALERIAASLDGTRGYKEVISIQGDLEYETR